MNGRLDTIWIFLVALALPATAVADGPAPAPNTTLLITADTFANGQSSNLGPAVSQTIDSYWTPGACEASNRYETCDRLRFGLTLAQDKNCIDQNEPLIAPQEDGGGLVNDRISTIHNESGVTFCSNENVRRHDDALLRHREFTFPEGASADAATLDEYWHRPNLTLMVVGELPQTRNNQHDDRVLNTLRQTCENFRPTDGLPIMPTWVMLARQYDHGAAPYAGLIAAAGGTGVCCYGAGCDPTVSPIDVCAHIEEPLRTEALIRDDMANGMYTCQGGTHTVSTGTMDYGSQTPFGTLPHIRCHLVGENNGDNCNKPDAGRRPTDILSLFACIRQLPRGVSSDDAYFWHCEDDGDSDYDDWQDECVLLTEESGHIEFIDENRTMFLINNNGECDIEVHTCEDEGAFCEVEGAQGRCAIGQIQCYFGRESCEPIFEPMPEICNGLDDDCDGVDDNMSTSWDDMAFSGLSLPSKYEGLDCQRNDVCVCPGGMTDNHAGDTFAQYLDAWDGVCNCGENLGYDEQPYSEAPRSTEDPQASCSSSLRDSGDTPAAVLLLMAFGWLFARRRR